MTPTIVQCVSQDSQCLACYHAKPHEKSTFCHLPKQKSPTPPPCPLDHLHATCAPVNAVIVCNEKELP